MMRLFNNPHFENIMQAVEPPGGGPKKGDFTAACQNAGLDPCETNWLWNYLKECKFAYYDCLPEAAASGW